MTSIPLPGGPGGNRTDWTTATFDDLFADAERNLARQRRRVRQMRRERRIHKRREAARMLRTHGRAGLFWIGTTAFTLSVAFFVFSENTVAIELFKLAVLAWTAAASFPPPPQA